MSILGLTIDYGPYGFLDRFDADHIPNTSDTDGRYRFRKQPEIVAWNLVKFAEALQPLVPLSQLKEILTENFSPLYNAQFMGTMMRKLGLFKSVDNDTDDLVSDKTLVAEFLQTLSLVGADYTNSFRKLNLLSLPGMEQFDSDFERTREELLKQSSTLEEMLDFLNSYVNSQMVTTRLFLLQNFPDQLKDDENTNQILVKLKHFSHVQELEPEQMASEVKEHWDSWLKMYIGRLNHEVAHLGDNQNELAKLDQERKSLMDGNNPCYVLRNCLAEEAIQKAEAGDYSEVKHLLKALEDPFTERPEFDRYTVKPTKGACKLRVSCSS